MTEQELKDRTKRFSLRVLKVVNALPDTVAGRAIGGQLIRSGASVAANIEQHVSAGQKLNLLQS